MDLEPIKSISCTDYLTNSGFIKDKKSNSNFSFFKSPLRDEKTASFAVNERKNTWFDYGSGFGGDVINLVMLMENIEFKEAVNKLNGSNYSHVSIKEAQPLDFFITDIKPLVNNNLLNYLRNERKINLDLAKKYCQEVHFENKKKKQYAIGFKNDKGGFELRNKFLKIATTPKWITTMQGTKETNIFEGFMDFLSAITYFNCEPKETIIVLNSASMISKVNVSCPIKFWGDNDVTGDKTFEAMKENAVDKRGLYKDYKDFNEFLVKRCNP
jgi:hypothetical protein